MSADATKITVETAAKLLMITPRHLQRLAKEGWVPKPYTVVGVVQGYIQWRDDSDKRGTATAAKARADDMKTKLLELRLGRESKKLMEVEEVEATFMMVFGMLKSNLIGFPASHTRDREERIRIEDGINNILQITVDQIEDCIRGVKT